MNIYESMSSRSLRTLVAVIARVEGLSSPQVDRIWGIWGSYYNIPKAIFCLLKADYKHEKT